METLVNLLVSVGGTKQYIYRKTIDVFEMIRQEVNIIGAELSKEMKIKSPDVEIEVKDSGKFEIDFKAGSDTLVFVMHTNVFLFPPESEVHKNPIVSLDPTKAYCGMILIYDFLSDTFKYNRLNDIGYLVGRIFINKSGQFFVQGKKQFSYLYPSFTDKEIDKSVINQLIVAAMTNAVEFETFAPPLDAIKQITYMQKIQEVGNSALKTGKRMGYSNFEY